MTERFTTHNDVSGAVVGTVIQANSVVVGYEREPRRDVWMAPESDRSLVERVDLANRLAGTLSPAGPDVGVVGPGGFGKTTLVAQVCHRVRSRFPGGVLWVTLGEDVPDSVLADKINDLCEILDGVRPSLTDPAMAGHRLGELLAERGATLLVIDDLWAASRLSAFPKGATVTRVITTRTRGALPLDVGVVPVGRMSPEESRSVLVAGVPSLIRTERLTQLTSGWALLLSLVNGAIRRSIEDGAVADLVAELIADQLSADGPGSLDLDSADRRDQAVRATVEASLRRLDAVGRARFLELGVFPEDVEIPVEVAHLLWSTMGMGAVEARRLDRRLADLSLIAYSSGTIRLHDVLRTYLRHALGADRLREVNTILVRALQTEAPVNWELARPYTLHHLASHAADAAMLDPLLTDAGFLLAATQATLLPSLSAAHSGQARTAALVYQRIAHHLRDQPHADRPAYLALAARRAGAVSLADSADDYGTQAAWRCSWAYWNAEPDHKILTRHIEAVVDVALATLPNGRTWSVSRSLYCDVHIVDVESNENIELPWYGQIEIVTAIDCVPMPDGRYLAVVGTEDGVQAWDLVSGQRTDWELPAGASGVAQIVWTEQAGRPIVIVGHWNHTIHAWDALTGRVIGEPVSFECHGDSPFWCIAAGALPDGRLAVAVSDEYAPVRLWEVATGRRVGADIAGHPFRTMGLAWGHRALFITGDSTGVQQWNVMTGRRSGADLLGHSEYTHTVVCTNLPGVGEVLICGGDDGTIRLWDTETGDLLGGPVAAHAYSVRAVACARLRDGRAVVVTGGNENTVRLWDIRVLAGEPSPHEALSPVVSVVHAGHLMISRHEHGGAQVWESGRVVRMPVTAPLAALGACGELAISSHHDGTTRLWDPAEGRDVAQLRSEHAAWVISCAVLPDNRRIAVLAGRGTVIEAWDLSSGDRLWRVRTRVRTKWETMGSQRRPWWITAIATTTLPDGQPIAVSATNDGTIRIWNLLTGASIGKTMNGRTTWQPSPAEVSAIACARLDDGRVVAITGSEDTTQATVAAWDLATCRSLTRSTIPTAWVGHAVCAMLPNGTRLAVTGDTVIRVWPLDALDPKTEWKPILEIDLDAPVTALDTDNEGGLVAATRYGLVRLHLQPHSHRSQ